MITRKDFLNGYRLLYPTIGTDSGRVVIPGPPQRTERRLKTRFETNTTQ